MSKDPINIAFCLLLCRILSISLLQFLKIQLNFDMKRPCKLEFSFGTKNQAWYFHINSAFSQEISDFQFMLTGSQKDCNTLMLTTSLTPRNSSVWHNQTSNCGSLHSLHGSFILSHPWQHFSDISLLLLEHLYTFMLHQKWFLIQISELQEKHVHIGIRQRSKVWKGTI